jgi:hypothetical protein
LDMPLDLQSVVRKRPPSPIRGWLAAPSWLETSATLAAFNGVLTDLR